MLRFDEFVGEVQGEKEEQGEWRKEWENEERKIKCLKLKFYVENCPHECMKKSWTWELKAWVLHWSRVLNIRDASFSDNFETWQLTKLFDI